MARDEKPKAQGKPSGKRPSSGSGRGSGSSNGRQGQSNPTKKSKPASAKYNKGQKAPGFKKYGKPSKHQPQQHQQKKKEGQPHLLKSKSGKTLPATHHDQRQLRDSRKRESNANYDLKKELKQHWENAREKKLKSEERMPHLQKMIDLSKGKLMEMIFQRDSARVVQCMIRYGSQKMKASIFSELKDHILDLCKSKYSRFIIPKLLQYGNRAQRNHIITAFYGHVRKLIRQRIANEVVATAYIDYATAKQRAALVKEFYGPQFAVFQSDDVSTLEAFIEQHPDKRVYVIKHIKQTLKPLLEKGLCQHHIVHRVLLDYIRIADEESKQQLIEEIKELLVEMVHTRDGASLALEVLKSSNAKTRKILLRSFKPYIPKICREQYGVAVVLACLDAVDDTKLLNKMVISEMLNEGLELAQDPNGRKALLYLVSPRDQHFFYPDLIAKLAVLDNNPNSKKDVDIRRAEVLQHAEKGLLALVKDHAHELCVGGEEALLLAEIIKKTSKGPMHAAAVDAVVAACFAEEDPLFEHPSGHRAIKNIIQAEAKQDDASLTSALAAAVDADDTILARMLACNRGAFVLLSIVESPKTAQDVAKRLAKAVVGAKDSSDDSKGVKLLIKVCEGVLSGKKVDAHAPLNGKNSQKPARKEEEASNEAEVAISQEIDDDDDDDEDEAEDDDDEDEDEDEDDDEDEDEDDEEEGDEAVVPPHTPKGKSPVLTRNQRRKSMRNVS